MNANLTQNTNLNGLDVTAMEHAVGELTQADAAGARVAFHVSTRWVGGFKMQSSVEGYELAGQYIPRSFKINTDEPAEILGTNTAPNPQELLMSALNSCMMVGYVAGATQRGIKLTVLEIECDAALDLRGAFGLDPNIDPGVPAIEMRVRIAGSGTPDQFAEIHQEVLQTSPNYFHVTRPIPVNAALEVI